jgi:FkbM family methyltransferase
MKFATALSREIISSLSNNFEDNFDYIRFQKPQEERGVNRIKKCIKKYLATKGFFRLDSNSRSSDISAYDDHIGNFEILYNLLNDATSKELLVKLLCYRIMGYKHVKLPVNNEDFWKYAADIEKIGDPADTIDVPFNNWKLCRCKLQKIGIPVELYFIPLGVYTDFILKQYEYSTPEVKIAACEGDVVIDAGGCWGDTALYFANTVGEHGKVYTFEFIPSNLEILGKNIALNPSLERIVDIVDRPVWSESDKILFYIDNGPGSKVTFDATGESRNHVSTLAIDDLVKTNEISRVDFIKMDIEGAELHALKGAEQTIRQYRPKLAISIYHRLEDFREIPEYLESLNLGYTYYLGHSSIHTEETVLFAINQ